MIGRQDATSIEAGPTAACPLQGGVRSVAFQHEELADLKPEHGISTTYSIVQPAAWKAVGLLGLALSFQWCDP